MNGFIPIIAHVERYKATRNDIGFLTELKDMGAHIQVNADTISGQDGFGAKTFARKVMKHGLLDFVGSDGHRKTERQNGKNNGERICKEDLYQKSPENHRVMEKRNGKSDC